LHESKCRNAHGHQYIVFIYATAENLDKLGRIIDFSVLKEKFQGWIDENWDHGFIYYEKDEEMEAALNMIKGQKKFALPYNPTAENLAIFLHTVVAVEQMKDTGITISKVEVWETENAFATAS
jgi:6-pyruvoyltetrahydropterin/6-carboxytetrahydropterin synthase